MRTSGLFTLFLLMTGFWATGCEILGNNPRYRCEPPRCPPNANCLNQCGDIFIADVDGGPPLNLTHNPAWETSPVWSPDGAEIAFVKAAGEGTRTINVMTKNGGNPRRLTEPGNHRTVRWSPDGAHLVFESDATLYVIRADGTGARRLPTASYSFKPQWSPDGRQILFFTTPDGQFHMHLINADGTNERRLISTPRGVDSAEWSPDGSQIVFTTFNDEGTSNLYVINTDGTGLKRLTSPDFYDYEPTWSPDGTHIAYVSGINGGSALTLIRADGSNRQVLVGGHVREPAWSPDGRALVYSNYQAEDGQGLYRIDLESETTQPLANVPTDEYNVQWSPDGSRILFGG